MGAGKGDPRISVVIPTFNRAGLLGSALEGFTRQTAGTDLFEVVVVDDGSSDATRETCEQFRGRLSLVYQRIENSGISAAKNLGVFVARGHLILFFDDDDLPGPTLLVEHIRTHLRHPGEGVAVLGHTDWAPWLRVSPVMHYIVHVGQMLFAYKHLRHGQELDFTYFWGGRSSCKRSFLVRSGVFNQSFRSIYEDIELGYRLSKSGLKVLYNRAARSYMIRPISFNEFCRRSERQGRSLRLLNRLHRDPMIQRYCEQQVPHPNECAQSTPVGAESWRRVCEELGPRLQRVNELEGVAGLRPSARDDGQLAELFQHYRWVFRAYRLRGFVSEEAERPPCQG